MHCGKPRDGGAGSTRPPCAEQVACLVGPAGIEARLQQRKFDQIVLRAAAADAFVFVASGANSSIAAE